MIRIEKRLPRGAGALINAYIDGNLPKEKRAEVESLVASYEEAARIFQAKSASRQELRALIPNKKPSKETLSLLKAELREVNQDLFKEKNSSLIERIAKFLDTTILEF